MLSFMFLWVPFAVPREEAWHGIKFVGPPYEDSHVLLLLLLLLLLLPSSFIMTSIIVIALV